MTLTSRRRAWYVALAMLASCTATNAPEQLDAAQESIIGGGPEAGYPAVVLLASWPDDLSVLALCTATLVAPDVLLTAAHCVDPETHPSWNFGVFLGNDASAFPTASTLVPQLLPIAAIHVHPEYDRDPPFNADLALVELPAPLTEEPMPMLWSALPAPLVGGPARLVGYGQTVYEEPNSEKYSVDTVLAAIDAGDTITVGDADHRSCIGDSGGPAIVEIEGVETVVGVNSYADLAGCLEAAHYRRTDLHVDFFAEFIEPPAEGGSGDAGGSDGDWGGANAGGSGDGETGTGGCSVAGRGGPSVLWFAGLFVLFGRRRTLSQVGVR